MKCRMSLLQLACLAERPKSRSNYGNIHRRINWKRVPCGALANQIGIFIFSSVVVVVASNNRFEGGGVWASSHIWSFTPPTQTKNNYVIESRDDNNVTDKRTRLFVAQHTSYRPIPSDFAGRRRDVTLTSQLVFDCRILQEYRVIRRLTKPTVTRLIGKNLDFGRSLPRKCSWHQRSATVAGNIRDLFQTQNGKIYLQIL